MSSPQIDALPFSPRHNEPLPPWVCIQKSRAYYPVFKSIKILEGDRGMDRCHYATFQHHFNRSTPEIDLSSTINYKLQESENERRAKLDDKITRE